MAESSRHLPSCNAHNSSSYIKENIEMYHNVEHTHDTQQLRMREQSGVRQSHILCFLLFAITQGICSRVLYKLSFDRSFYDGNVQEVQFGGEKFENYVEI